jgi:hypothetical protein
MEFNPAAVILFGSYINGTPTATLTSAFCSTAFRVIGEKRTLGFGTSPMI